MEIVCVDDDAAGIALFVEVLHNADRSIKFSYALDINDALGKLNNYLSILMQYSWTTTSADWMDSNA